MWQQVDKIKPINGYFLVKLSFACIKSVYVRIKWLCQQHLMAVYLIAIHLMAIYLVAYLIATQYISFERAREASGLILRILLNFCCIILRSSADPSP